MRYAYFQSTAILHESDPALKMAEAQRPRPRHLQLEKTALEIDVSDVQNANNARAVIALAAVDVGAGVD